MRLQFEIQRHTLPPVNIIYNTSSSPTPIRTVADLLGALHKIIPLESEDGEWGFEDYIIEVAATSDQLNLYECLHYQFIKDVFKEDDEVIVRGLTSDEIKERRRGGRLQILPDGVHLVDGVAWGRRYNVNAHRPGIAIPPRKRRRLLPPEEENADRVKEALQLTYNTSDAKIGTIIDEEQDDEEYEDNEDSSDEEEESLVEEASQHPVRIVTREEFDDADVDFDSDVGEDSDSDSAQNEKDGLEEDELQLLLQEADQVEEAYQSLPLEVRITSPQRKRKRASAQENGPEDEDTVFNGFSSPVKKRRDAKDPDNSRNGVKGQIGTYMVTEPFKGGVSGTSVARANGDLSMQSSQAHSLHTLLEVAHLVPTAANNNGGGSSSESTSSSGTSDIDSDNDLLSDSSADSDSDSGSNSDSDPDASSDAESTSDSDITSSSGDSDSDSEGDSDAVESSQHSATAVISKFAQGHGGHSSQPQVDNPPGTGTVRTKANNLRAKLRKRLAILKEQKILPAEANFEDLRQYEATRGLQDNQDIDKPSEFATSELAQRKEEMLARLGSVYGHQPPEKDEMDSEPQRNQSNIENSQPQPPISETQFDQDPVRSEMAQPETTASTEKPAQRSKLDIESSRRMLFASLGLRNPKTPAAEQALREKLSKPTRKVQSRQLEKEDLNPSSSTSKDDSWKEKLIISAVECVQEGLVLSPPPFPFKQRWERESSKRRRSSEQEHHQMDTRGENEVASRDEYYPLQIESTKPFPDSAAVSAGHTDLNNFPYPTDVQNYPNLKAGDVQINAIIAYKQLYISSNFEPAESEYRIARVVAIDGETIDVILSKRDRDVHSAQFDQATGERIFNKFEIPVDDGRIEDDGLRETTFEDMIGPKLIQAASVQVPSSDRDEKVANNETQPGNDSAVVPESVPAREPSGPDVDDLHIDVDTPRRTEISNIIKSAGFNSGLDEQLLQPIDVPTANRATDLSNRHSSTKTTHSKGAKKSSKFSAKEWRSSPDAENDTSQLQDRVPSSVLGEPSSPPSISMVETVNYPHVSQIDINHSSLPNPTMSSSYQDAQRVSPHVYDVEHNDLKHLRVKYVASLDREDSQASSLPSEVPQSQTNGASAQVGDEASNDNATDEPIKLQGDDTAEALDFDSDPEDMDSDGLPSLHSLTASQKERVDRASSSRGLSRVSPPPTRRDRSTINTTNTVFPSPDSPQPQIKISASQQPSINVAHIQHDTSIVDLTLSSDPVEPPECRGEGNTDGEDDGDHDSPRARRRAARTSVKDGTNSQKEDRGAARAMRGALTGLGARRSLGGKGRSRV